MRGTAVQAQVIKFYDDAYSATTVGITSQTLLGTCLCSDPAGVESGGTLTFSAISRIHRLTRLEQRSG